jgi:N-acetylglucosamine-6-phosphate deacetylase
MHLMSIHIENGTVLHYDRVEAGSCLTTDGARIARISPSGAPASADTVLDASGCYVLPGLIDIHTHGLGTVGVDEGSIFEYSRLQARAGVTACVPTLAGSPKANIERMKGILAETKDLALAPNLVGFRPEIMYLVDASAGPSSSLARPEPSITNAVWDASRGLIRIWDVSPEIDGALPFISWCTERGIVTSMAHSSATIPQLRAAIDCGLSLITHFYDLFPIPKEIDEGVYPAGVVDYINVEDRVTAEIIPDGVHVHPLLVEKTLRCKGCDRVAFITDSLKGSGLPPGTYDGIIPGEPIEVTRDRGIRRKSDGILSGSTLTLIEAFRNAVRKFGLSLALASALCSRTPARLLRMPHKGFLAAGMDADIIVLDQELALKAVIVQGEVVWRA